MLRNHGSAEQGHNFKTVDCTLRDFGEMRNHIENQISKLTDLEEKYKTVEEFFKYAVDNDRNDYERKFRVRGKHHDSVIGRNNSCVDSMEYVLGGGLHNEIGLVNDCLKILFDGLDGEELTAVPEEIRTFLDSPRSVGGAGCSPGQYHGGQYNGKRFYSFFMSLVIPFLGKDAAKIFSLHEELFNLVPETFSRKSEFKVLFTSLNKIFSKTRVARFLSSAEISELEEDVICLSEIIHSKFKQKSITVKMHDVLVHTVPFVKKYHTIGLFNEQALESLHQIMHIDEKRYIHLDKEPLKKIKYVMDQQNIRATLD